MLKSLHAQQTPLWLKLLLMLQVKMGQLELSESLVSMALWAIAVVAAFEEPLYGSLMAALQSLQPSQLDAAGRDRIASVSLSHTRSLVCRLCEGGADCQL